MSHCVPLHVLMDGGLGWCCNCTHACRYTRHAAEGSALQCIFIYTLRWTVIPTDIYPVYLYYALLFTSTNSQTFSKRMLLVQTNKQASYVIFSFPITRPSKCEVCDCPEEDFVSYMECNCKKCQDSWSPPYAFQRLKDLDAMERASCEVYSKLRLW